MLRKIKKHIYYKFYFYFFAEIEKEYIILPKGEIKYANDLLYTYHNADFMTEPKFIAVYDKVKSLGGTLLENYDIQWRIHVMCWFANQAKTLEGDFVDCGVNTGFCPRAVIDYTDFNSFKKKYILFDTFAGMDPRFSSPHEMERHSLLQYGKDENLYAQVCEEFINDNVVIIKGAIPDSLEAIEIEKIAYLSIDMNCVYPELMALNFFWDKLVKGGVIILDDYGYPGCIDQKIAHDQFAKSKGVEILSLPTCQGIIFKPH